MRAATASSDVPQKRVMPNAWNKRKVMSISCCVFSFVATVGLLFFFLTPRDPDWEVLKVSFTSKDKNKLYETFLDPTFNETFTFWNIATVEVWNPNFVGASVKPGNFNVTFKSLPLAQVVNDAAVVGRRSHSKIKTNNTVTITSEMSKVLFAAATESFSGNGGGKLNLGVKGNLPAKVGLLNIHVALNCDVEVNVFGLEDTPNLVTGHKCKYSLRF